MKAIILSFMTALAVVSTFAVSAQSAPVGSSEWWQEMDREDAAAAVDRSAKMVDAIAVSARRRVDRCAEPRGRGPARPWQQVRVIGQLPIGRQLVDDAGQHVRELREQIVVRQPRLLRQVLYGAGPERLLKLARRYRLVRPGADPGVDRVLEPVLPELIDQPA